MANIDIFKKHNKAKKKEEKRCTEEREKRRTEEREKMESKGNFRKKKEVEAKEKES